MSQHGLQSGAGTKTNISIETRSWPRWPVVFRPCVMCLQLTRKLGIVSHCNWYLGTILAAAPCRSQPPEYRLSGGSWQCLTNDCVQQDICRHLPRVCRLHTALCCAGTLLLRGFLWFRLANSSLFTEGTNLIREAAQSLGRLAAKWPHYATTQTRFRQITWSLAPADIQIKWESERAPTLAGRPYLQQPLCQPCTAWLRHQFFKMLHMNNGTSKR